MTLQRAIAALLISTGLFGGIPDPELSRPIYEPEVYEKLIEPADLVYDEPVVCETGTCKSSRKGLFSRKPLRKMFKKLRCK